MALSKEQEKVLSRVMKLLQMTTENGCTEAEASSAKQMVEKLLAEYQLTQKDISLSDMEIHEFEPSYDDEGNYYIKTPTWLRALLTGINKAFGCSIVYGMNDAGETLAYQTGRTSDIEIADYCYLSIRRQVNDLTENYVIENNLKRNSALATSFRESLVTTVLVNLNDILGKVPSANVSSDGRAVMVVDENIAKAKEASQHLATSKGLTLVHRSSTSRYNSAGVDAASKVSVNSAMSGGSSQPKYLAR